MTDANKFDRMRGMLEGRPDVRRVRPTTISHVLPIVGDSGTYVVETVRADGELVSFLQIVDSDGGQRLILPDKVVRGIVAQVERLTDRSTPESRARAQRTRELVARRRRDHEAGKHDPAARTAAGLPAAMRGCPLCAAGVKSVRRRVS